MPPYGPNWSAGACELENCRYCTDGWVGTCPKCGGPRTHQPEWADKPDAWQVLVCPECGYEIEPDFNGRFAASCYYVAPPDPSNPSWSQSETKWPDNLALKILKNEDIVEDHPQQFCAVQSCGQPLGCIQRTDCPESAVDKLRKKGISVTGGAQGRWDAHVPICGHHAHKRWFAVIGRDGDVYWRNDHRE